MSDYPRTREEPRLKIATKRHIDLLQPIIPVLISTAAANVSTMMCRSNESEFWTDFLSPWLLIGKGSMGNLSTMKDEQASSLKDILRILESMVNLQSHAMTEDCGTLQHPRLQTIKQLFLESNDGIERQAFMKRIILVKPTTQADCNNIIEQLSILINGLRRKAQPPPIEEYAILGTRRCLMSQRVLRMCSTFSECWECLHQHKAAIPLYTHNPETNVTSFTVFLSTDHHPNEWQETCVTVAEKFIIAETQNSCLKLNLQGNSLSHRFLETSEVPWIKTNEILHLSDSILSAEQIELSFQPKIYLALVLSYCFNDFHGEPWFPQTWSRDSIYLTESTGQLSFLPYLEVQMKLANSPSNQETTAIDTRLLQHGLLLMEIFLQESLGVDISPEKGLTELRQEIKDCFNCIEWDVHERYCQVVATCINGDLHSLLPDLSQQSNNDSVEVFYKRAVAPLEFEFAKYWEGMSLDEAMSTLKFPGLKSPGSAMVKRAMESFVPIDDFAQIRFGSSPQSPRFFDVADVVEKAHINGARKWFTYFKPYDFESQLKVRSEGKSKKIRIAVLDTGVNLENQWISKEHGEGRIKCWPHGDCHDETGHGTHVAYLILRLARHIELHVHKISKSERLDDVDIDVIAKAIKHSSHGEGKVDIINLSFGFERYEGRLRPILDSIRAASENGVLVFAAAGNKGLNGPSSWPASLEEDVIQINASDSDGRASGFSSDDGGKGKIYTLGKGVPSCIRDSDGNMIHNSGTSFATPIAVAIAALVLGFVDSFSDSGSLNDELNDVHDLIPIIRTRRGMEEVLRQVCVLPATEASPGVAYITPWHFLKYPEQARILNILQILRSLLERGLTK